MVRALTLGGTGQRLKSQQGFFSAQSIDEPPACERIVTAFYERIVSQGKCEEEEISRVGND